MEGGALGYMFRKLNSASIRLFRPASVNRFKKDASRAPA